MWYSLLLGFAFAQDMTIKTMKMIEKRYLWLDEVEPKNTLISAAEELEREIPWLVVHSDAEKITFHVGQEPAFWDVSLANVTIKNMSIYLEDIRLGITQASKTLPENTEVDILLLDGVLRSLDRYSVLLYDDKLEAFNERISGNFSGIGCRVTKVDQGLRVEEVFADGPAYIQGLEEGDIITFVDGVSLAALTLAQGVDRLRGEAGSVVRLDYLHMDAQHTATLTRATVRIPNVHWKVQDNVGIITIRNFSEQTMLWMEKALEEFATQQLQGIVLDLRGNGGGSMSQACKVVDAFVKDRLTLRTAQRSEESNYRMMDEYINKDDGTEPNLPLIVLIDSDSASASEIVAGALKLLDRALIVGQRSFGKGVVQTVTHLRRPGLSVKEVSLKLTIAQYLLLDDYSVHENGGVLPHIQLGTLQYQHPPFAGINVQKPDLLFLDNGEDKELQFAIDVLQQSSSMSSMSVAKMREVALSVIQEWQPKENTEIEKQFTEHHVDWQYVEKTQEQPNYDLDISVISDSKFTAGTKGELELAIYNKGDTISQAFLWLQADSSGSPWDDIMVPIGYIAPESAVTATIPMDIPLQDTYRIDSIKPLLVQSCCDDIELAPIMVETLPGEIPNIETNIHIESIQEKNTNSTELWYRAHIDLENKNDIDWNNLHVRMIWPAGIHDISMVENEWTESIFAHGQSKNITVDFSSAKPIEEQPEFLLRVDVEEYSKVLRQEIRSSQVLQKQTIQIPSLAPYPEKRMNIGQQVIAHQIADDGGIVQYEAWWNGQKVYWQEGMGPVKYPVDVNAGANRLYVEIVDDQGYKTQQSFSIWGDVPSE